MVLKRLLCCSMGIYLEDKILVFISTDITNLSSLFFTEGTLHGFFFCWIYNGTLYKNCKTVPNYHIQGVEGVPS